MGLIVHLTDLHLGAGGSNMPADDRKVGVISDAERTTVREVAEENLRRLADTIDARGATISALVLSGDITVRGGAQGYAELDDFLEGAFGAMLPPPERIIATPGNHDVAWYETDPLKRYEQFLAHCVAKGWVTPPLDGIDLHDGRKFTNFDKHCLIDEEGWFIVPLNSSNWSGTMATLYDRDNKVVPESAIDALKNAVAADPAHSSLLEQLLRFRQFDMPRVSKEQVRAFKNVANYAGKRVERVADPLPIAVMHHQLSPVGEREEIKPFESLSNLGRVREVMKDVGVCITLHGHKHDRLTMWNTIETGSPHGRGLNKHAMLVVSGGTIGGSARPDPASFASVIEITPMLKGHDVRVGSLRDYIEHPDRSDRGYFLSGRRFEPVGASGGHIDAINFDDGYARLIAEGGVARNTAKNLSITIQTTDGVNAPPAGYPADAAGEGGALPLDRWFSEVTDWWQAQLVEAPRGLFTHGRRLKLHRGEPDADQIAAMTRTLQDRRPSNGRAIATLIDPGSDLLGSDAAAPASFPAFCLVQLHIRTSGNRTFLDATAYFRKQEMRYWWPVNVAEIRQVMEAARADLKDVELGSITTIAAVAVWQTSRSRVSIPAIDRLYLKNDEGRHDLMRMAAFLAQSAAGTTRDEADRLLHLWQVVLEDIVPPEEAVKDSIPVAVEGVGFLKEAVRAQKAVCDDPAVRARLGGFTAALSTLEEKGRALWALGRESHTTRFAAKLKQNVAEMSAARTSLIELLGELPHASCSTVSGGEQL